MGVRERERKKEREKKRDGIFISIFFFLKQN